MKLIQNTIQWRSIYLWLSRIPAPVWSQEVVQQHNHKLALLIDQHFPSVQVGSPFHHSYWPNLHNHLLPNLHIPMGAERICCTFYLYLPISKSNLTHYLSNALVMWTPRCMLFGYVMHQWAREDLNCHLYFLQECMENIHSRTSLANCYIAPGLAPPGL